MLWRGLSPQNRWDRSGEAIGVPIRESGIRQEITLLFSSETTFRSTLKTCIEHGSIVSVEGTGGTLRLSLGINARTGLVHSGKQEELGFLGLVFTAHIYPRDQALDPR